MAERVKKTGLVCESQLAQYRNDQNLPESDNVFVASPLNCIKEKVTIAKIKIHS